MKKASAMLFVLLVLQIPVLGYASHWENFIYLKDRYYYLDNQDFKNILCQVDVPLVQAIVEEIKHELAPLQDKIEVTDNVAQFSMLYSPEDGLSFIKPELEIRLITVEGVADPVGVKYGIEETKDGFQEQLDGIIEYTRRIFDEFSFPRQEQYRNVIVYRSNDVLSVSYTKEDFDIYETYHGLSVEAKQSDQFSEITSRRTFVKDAAGKLVVSHIAASTNHSAGVMNVYTSVEYQNIEHILFPKQIQTHFEKKVQASSQNDVLDIRFINCKVR